MVREVENELLTGGKMGTGVEQAPLLQPLETETETDATNSSPRAGPERLPSRRVGWDSGTTCVAVAAFLFAFQAALVKIISPHGVPVFEIVVIRSLLSMAFTLVTAFTRGIHPVFGRLRHWHMLASRGLVGAAAMTVFYESLQRLPLADSISILFCNPAICSVYAWLLLGERFGLLTGLGCLASMGGVVLVARPPAIFGSAAGAHEEWSHDRMVGMILAISGAFLTSGAYIAIRIISMREPPLTIAAWFHTSALVSNGIPLALGYPNPVVLPRLADWACLLGIGCCSFTAQLLLNRGFQIQVAAKAAAVNYTQVIYAHALGLLLFHETISWLGVLGALLIALGVVTVNADNKSGPATKPASIGGPRAPIAEASKMPQPLQEGDGAEGQQQLNRDQHGQLKAKLSFKQLLPFGLGRGGLEQQDGYERTGNSSSTPRGSGTHVEQELLLPAYGREGAERESRQGGLQAGLRVPELALLQPLTAERHA